jgi:hypothetical protein
MHHSGKADKRSLFIRCYLDESGTHDSSSYAVVAGLVTDRDGFLSLDDEWVDLLARYKVEPPLHMTEFGQHGRHGHLNYKERSKLLWEAVEIINRYKKYSIAATLGREKYEKIIPVKVRQHFSQYVFCFVLCAAANHQILELAKYKDDIPYILHHGNPRAGDILAAHQACLNRQRTGIPFHMRSIQFDDGSRLGTLQAADMIAWGVRRRINNVPFDKGFQPVSGLFKRRHQQPSWTDQMLREFAERFLAGNNENHKENK